MLDATTALDRLIPVVKKVGAMQRQQLGRTRLTINTKSSGIDLVTEVDVRSEKMLVDFIRANYPDHDILAEEGGLSPGSSAYRWIIDPLDGTTNYAQGLPIFAVSVALQEAGRTILGVVYSPVTGQLFSGVRGAGAFLNGGRLTVSAKQELGQCVLATGFPYDIATHPVNNLSYFSALMLKTRAVRRMGAAAYDLACTAAGKFDGYWEMSLKPWDMAAGALLVEEAGGIVRPFRQDRGISIIAGNSQICDKIEAELRLVDNGC